MGILTTKTETISGGGAEVTEVTEEGAVEIEVAETEDEAEGGVKIDAETAAVVPFHLKVDLTIHSRRTQTLAKISHLLSSLKHQDFLIPWPQMDTTIRHTHLTSPNFQLGLNFHPSHRSNNLNIPSQICQ